MNFSNNLLENVPDLIFQEGFRKLVLMTYNEDARACLYLPA